MPCLRLQVHRLRSQHHPRSRWCSRPERRTDAVGRTTRLMIVMKFGGSSLESAEAIRRVAGIVVDRLARKPVVVVSAMGKTTNKLLAVANEAVAGNREEALRLLAELREYTLRETRPLVDTEKLEQIIATHFNDLEELAKGLS